MFNKPTTDSLPAPRTYLPASSLQPPASSLQLLDSTNDLLMSYVVWAKFAASEVTAPNRRGNILVTSSSRRARETGGSRFFRFVLRTFFCYALTDTKPAVVALIISKSASIQRQNKMAVSIL